ncbi:MAG: serpin family protein [Lewinellaceae bacterium]|nr:serpin family protein [Phaeodactylibacter sp.]MCB9037628.1 serpin family protein [Lewinellaceae bacterium]
MKKVIPLLLLGSLLLFSQCNKEDTVKDPDPVAGLNCEANTEACQVSAANTEFGFNLFRELHEEAPDKNVFISPLSVATALSMTVNGAEGQTRADMMATLEQTGLSLEQANEGFRQLLTLLPALDPEVQLLLANSIWYRQGFPAKEPFLSANRDYFDSEVAELNFADPQARVTINNWVNSNTNGLIESIVDQPIPSNVVMYLINAVYFKGAWRHPFDPEFTAPWEFQLENGSTTEVQMMNYGQGFLPYFENEMFQAIDLAYADSAFTMSVFLPKQGHTVDEVISQMNNANWDLWTQSFVYQELFFQFPKFKMKYEESLVKVLTDMGMGLAFAPGLADFSGIADAALNIDEVRHKAVIEVNEEGSEAAAVTSVVIVETSVPLIPMMYVDKPFVFAIRDAQSNGILFIGKMMNPNEN